MNQSLDNVKLSQLKKVVEKLDERYKGENIDLSFEFLVGSFYPHVLQNVQKALSDAYTKGFIEGITERKNSEHYKIQMSGLNKDVQKIIKLLEESKQIICDAGYGLDDAPFHGWSGEPLQEQKVIRDTIEFDLEDLIVYCKDVIGESK